MSTTITTDTPVGSRLWIKHHYGIDRPEVGTLIAVTEAPCGLAAEILVKGKIVTINAHEDFVGVIGHNRVGG